jgi:hypothetical protein
MELRIEPGKLGPSTLPDDPAFTRATRLGQEMGRVETVP